MAKLLRITRAIKWMAQAFVANRDPNPTMDELYDVISPTVDVFGNDRLREAQIETFLGALGGLEIVHQAGIGSAVNTNTTRHYLSIEVFHDDPVARLIRQGRIVPTPGGFPFGGYVNQELLAAGITMAVRNVVVAPRQLIAAQANAMAAGARMVMTVVWVEMPEGEYLTGVT